jgi:hypothetical protein
MPLAPLGLWKSYFPLLTVHHKHNKEENLIDKKVNAI